MAHRVLAAGEAIRGPLLLQLRAGNDPDANLSCESRLAEQGRAEVLRNLLAALGAVPKDGRLRVSADPERGFRVEGLLRVPLTEPARDLEGRQAGLEVGSGGGATSLALRCWRLSYRFEGWRPKVPFPRERRSRAVWGSSQHCCMKPPRAQRQAPRLPVGRGLGRGRERSGAMLRSASGVLPWH